MSFDLANDTFPVGGPYLNSFRRTARSLLLELFMHFKGVILHLATQVQVFSLSTQFKELEKGCPISLFLNDLQLFGHLDLVVVT